MKRFPRRPCRVQGGCLRQSILPRLDSVLLLESLVLLPESVDAVNHGLDEGNLRVSQPVLVGDVIRAT